MTTRLGLSGVKPRVYVPDYPTADLTFNWLEDRHRVNGVSARSFTTSAIPGLSSSRAHTNGHAYVYNARTGLWMSVAANVPRVGPAMGLLIEDQRVTLAPKSRRLDDGLIWTPSNITPSAVMGVDGVAASATRLIAGAANATVLAPAVTSASAARRLAPFIRRVAGTGNIDLTLDGGSTWTTLTGVTSSWQRLPIGATVTNPRVGIRLASSGDEVDVDFLGGETGSFDTSPIESLSANATRGADNISLGGLSAPAAFTLFTQASRATAAATSFAPPASLNDGTITNEAYISRHSATHWGAFSSPGGVGGSTIMSVASAASSGVRIAARVAANDGKGALNGSLATGGGSATATVPAYTRLSFGVRGNGATFWNDYIERVMVFPTALNDAALIALTT